MRYVALDVETANARMRSICQIGVVVFENGVEVASDSRLIDPREDFDGLNISIHGIEPEHVEGKQTFAEAQEWLEGYIRGQVVACHTHFDRVSIKQATAYSSVPEIPCTWLDTAMVARRAWEQYAYFGYGLASLAEDFGITFQHHDALHDARTCGLILQKAIAETGLTAAQWVDRCKLTLAGVPKRSGWVKREGDGDGPLLGETVVFTGALTLTRNDAADLAHLAGGRVDPNVTKKTTILVVGDRDLDRFSGVEKSTKHRKAETLAAKGQAIRFLAEGDFMKLVEDEIAALEAGG